MLYFDNAATTWPKPSTVVRAVSEAMTQFGANPGRGGHKMSLDTARLVYECREKAATFFGLSDPSGVVFVPNCTTALNVVIQGALRHGGRVLISNLEHNAVLRPCYALGRSHDAYDVAAWSADEDELVHNFSRAITPQTKLIVCMHASNVFGVTFPIERLARVAHEHGVVFCVDAAQTAGVLPIHMEKMGIDYLCVAAHKGLYAPMGSGLLLCNNREGLPPLVRGGTGSYSKIADQPDELPDRLESGTLNVPLIAGIAAGINFVNKVGVRTIYRHEMHIVQQLYDGLATVGDVQLYTARPTVGNSAPVLSLNIKGIPCETVAGWLDEQGVAVRAGLHCAPMAHRAFGTLDTGTVRLAPSAFTNAHEVEKICKLFKQFAQKSLHQAKNVL